MLERVDGSPFVSLPGYQACTGPGVSLLAYPGLGHDELMGWSASRHSVILYLGVRIGDMAVESDRLTPHRFEPFTLLYRPPDVDYVHNCHHAADIIEVRFDESMRTHLLEAGAGHFVPSTGHSAPHMATMAKALNGLLYGSSGGDPLAVESAACGFLLAATEAASDGSGSPVVESRRLDRGRLNRTLALIEAKLGERIGLTELAAEVDLNVHHFAKAFRATTGSTPYQHITARRVSRARIMLETSDDEIADVALACGFSSQSHLTDQFRRRIGTTPARYRRAVSDVSYDRTTLAGRK